MLFNDEKTMFVLSALPLCNGGKVEELYMLLKKYPYEDLYGCGYEDMKCGDDIVGGCSLPCSVLAALSLSLSARMSPFLLFSSHTLAY